MAFQVFPLEQILMYNDFKCKCIERCKCIGRYFKELFFPRPCTGYFMNKTLRKTFHSGELCKDKLVEDVVYTCNIKM